MVRLGHPQAAPPANELSYGLGAGFAGAGALPAGAFGPGALPAGAFGPGAFAEPLGAGLPDADAEGGGGASRHFCAQISDAFLHSSTHAAT